MIYIGHFSYNDEMDDKDSFVLMPLIVSAENADEAMEKFADHLLDVHSHSDLLEGAGQIYQAAAQRIRRGHDSGPGEPQRSRCLRGA